MQARMKDLDDDRLHAWVALLQAHRAVVDAVEHRLQQERGLSLAWYEVLVQLAASPDGSLRMHDLARGVLLSRSGLTRLVDRMETAGLIRRTTCPTDRRGTQAVLTAKGRRTLHRAAPSFYSALGDRFGRHLDGDDVRSLRTALRKLLEGNGEREASDCHARLLEEPAEVATG